MQNDSSIHNFPTLKQVFYKIFLFYKEHILKLTAVILVFLIPFMFVEHYVWRSDWVTHQLSVRLSEFMFGVVAVGIIIVAAMFFLVYFFTLILAVDDFDQKKESSIIILYKRGFKVFLLGIKLNILYLFKVLLWSLALVIPGLIKLFEWSLVSFLVLLGGKSLKDCFGISQREIKPHFSKYALQSIFLLCFVLALWNATIEIFDFLFFLTEKKGSVWLSTVVDGGQVFFILIIGVIPVIFYYQYYKYFIKHIDIGKGCYGKCN